MPWFNRWFNSRRILFASVLILVGIGACGPMTAVELNGTEIRAKVTDFRFVGAVEQCVLEVRAGKPYAVIVDCWALGRRQAAICRLPGLWLLKLGSSAARGHRCPHSD
ncbi:hypothetical protein OAD22_01940 [Pseudomonadales bacterium]|nr:hypothetical protein [Pseudomonadales bacterium]